MSSVMILTKMIQETQVEKNVVDNDEEAPKATVCLLISHVEQVF
jgi:hypothetical protein